MFTKYLIEHGADINAIDAFNVTPIHNAVLNKAEKTAKYLTESGASLNIKDAKGRTAIQAAQEKNLPDLVIWFEKYITEQK